MSISRFNPSLWKTDFKILNSALKKSVCQSFKSAFRTIKNTCYRFILSDDRKYQVKQENLRRFMAKIEKVDSSSNDYYQANNIANDPQKNDFIKSTF